MPKKSTKSKSKRTTLKQKYKLIKKVKEHHRKKRKEENKKKRLGIKPKAPKDPGIPAQWPYKDELMKEIDFEVEKKRQKEEEKAEEKRLRRAENKKRAREAMEAGLPPPTLEDLRRRADDRAETHEAKRLAKLDDRMGGDLRPLAHAAEGLVDAPACHPYDACTALVLDALGCPVHDPRGGALDAPLDTTTPVAWVGYANPALEARVRPIVERLVERLFSSR